MKKLSRLTALLLAIVMLLSTTAIAEDGFPQSEFNLQRYNQMHTDVQQRGLIDSAYEHYVQELAKLDTAARYAKLVSWHDSGLLGDIFYSSFVNYYKTAHPNGTLICTCASPLPYGGEGHADGCPWRKIVGNQIIDEETGVSVVGDMPANVQLSVEEATLDEVLTVAPELMGELGNVEREHKVFDISMLMNNSEWQPGEGETVSVTMDVSDVSDAGDDMLVFHVHEDENGVVSYELVGVSEVNDGKIQFDMSGFSYILVVNGEAKFSNIEQFYTVYGKSGNKHFEARAVYITTEGNVHLILVGNQSQADGCYASTVSIGEEPNKMDFSLTKADTANYGIVTSSVIKNADIETDVTGLTDSKYNYLIDINLGKNVALNGAFVVSVTWNDGTINGFKIEGMDVTIIFNDGIQKTVYSVNGEVIDYTEVELGYVPEVQSGDKVVYEVIVKNGAESTQKLTNVSVTDTLPANIYDLNSIRVSKDRTNWNQAIISADGVIQLGDPFDLSKGQEERYYVEVSVLDDVDPAVYTNKATMLRSGETYKEASADVEVKLRKGSLVITKTVNKEGFTGGTFTFEVSNANKELVATSSITLPAESSVTIPDLLAGDYTVTETSRDGYKVTGEETVPVPAGGSVTVNVINTASEKTSVEAKKIWVDNNDALKLRPDDVTLTLYANGTAVEGTPTVAKDGNEWTYTWTNVEKYDTAGNLIKYTVGEQTVPTYYEKNEDGLTVTNTLTAGKLIITKEVKKSDYSGQTFSFTVNGQTQEITVPKAESGSVHTASGDAIILTQGTYPVSETAESKAGYSVTGEGNVEVKPGEVATITITNTATGDTKVTATKVWADNNNELGLRTDVSLTVTGNGQTYTNATVNKNTGNADQWEYTFEVPKYNADGNVITYTADEANVPENYQKTTNGLTVTNTLTAGKLMINKTVKKEDYVAETFTFTVDAKPYSITVPATAGSTVHTGSLGNAIVLPAGTYTVTETGAAKYSTTMQNGTATAVSDKTIEVTITAGQTTTVNVVNTASEQIELSVSKEWEDNENMWNLRPESVSIELNGMVGETTFEHNKDDLTLTADGSWSGSWQNVPKYDGEGRLITYTVTEAAAAKYTSSVTDNEAHEFIVTNTLNTYDLTIRKAGLDLNLDPHSSTMYQVVGENGIAVDMTVAIHGNSSVTIKNLPQGIYTVNELTDWSWRYSSSSNRTNDQVDVDGTDDTITFTNTRNEIYWLDSDCYAENRFTGSGAVATINPTK